MTLTAPERADIAEAAEKLADLAYVDALSGSYCKICRSKRGWTKIFTIAHTPDCLVTKLRAIAGRVAP